MRRLAPPRALMPSLMWKLKRVVPKMVWLKRVPPK
jgi:hypothetical protein